MFQQERPDNTHALFNLFWKEEETDVRREDVKKMCRLIIDDSHIHHRRTAQTVNHITYGVRTYSTVPTLHYHTSLPAGTYNTGRSYRYVL
jgi:hypothetical protein